MDQKVTDSLARLLAGDEDDLDTVLGQLEKDDLVETRTRGGRVQYRITAAGLELLEEARRAGHIG